MQRVFISYSRRDHGYVDSLVSHIESSGQEVWFDRANLVGGQQWRKQIVSAIKGSDVVIAVLTEYAVRSRNVRKEIDLAEKHRRPIIPVRLLPCEIPDDLEYQLAGVQEIDFADDYEKGIERLLAALRDVSPIAEPAAGPDPLHDKANELISLLSKDGAVEDMMKRAEVAARDRSATTASVEPITDPPDGRTERQRQLEKLSQASKELMDKQKELSKRSNAMHQQAMNAIRSIR